MIDDARQLLRSWVVSGLVVLVLAALGVLGQPAPARAQSVESVFSPGALVRGHADLEARCEACHVRFNRGAQDGLCLGCHKDVARDVEGRRGMHGRMNRDTCRSCHTDHKGREARIAPLDERRFDHARTDFALKGAHAGVACASCHKPGTRRREAPSDCLACHRKDDRHRGQLGTACADCHGESSWKNARFDHDRTRFKLTGGHRKATCKACHADERYRETPTDCVACHRKDDRHKERLGVGCAGCHGTDTWKQARFDHDTATRYALRGRHRTASCESCHTQPLATQKLGTTCNACHAKDDKHKGTLGTECASCHAEGGWKDPPRFDHGRSRFPLNGGHRRVACTDCHRSANYREAPTDCLACHRRDDKHAGTLGKDCANCHVDTRWRDTPGFDHARTRFALRNGHASPPVACKACHADPARMRDTPTECVACHRKDDVHKGSQGDRCGSCHDDTRWSTARFDHARTAFPLIGRHRTVTCASCHADKRYKGAPTDCLACHRKDDTHRAVFGTDCAGCHNARSWKSWTFDHGRRTPFPLDGAHRSATCAACHRDPAPAGAAAAPVGTTCVACHADKDRHDGRFGPACERCHDTTDWRRFHAPGTVPKGAPR